MRVAVITISDRASRGEYADISGPEIEKAVLALYGAAEVSRQVVPDDEREIWNALEAAAGADFILTTGGTGISPRDVTPEVTMKFCHRELPGIAEVLRAQSYRGRELPRFGERGASLHEGARPGHGARHADARRRRALSGAALT
jgi:molybdenum cofactor synthesis domain-containing protein